MTNQGDVEVRYPNADSDTIKELEDADAGRPGPTSRRCDKAGARKGIQPAMCTECGMVLDRANEFHPYAFCVMKKAGLDPWEEAHRIHVQLTHHEPMWSPKPRARKLPRSRAGSGGVA